ncbi:hypothetical protein Bca4012_034123 [Brassica carinata]|uniref:F-box domain-containing protein n=1 Tax=Brassica oleracea TaxID=3712 RepID=A0A3P6CLD1_BRAOL|nr:unnamed protein product [Brassica oleracea]
MELPHGLIRDILEKLPVKSLLRFKSVSTQWKSTIESAYFKKKQLLYSQLQDPDILITNRFEGEDKEHVTRMFTIGSSDLIKLPNVCPVPMPIPLENKKSSICYTYSVCGCDGMICYYNYYTCIYLVNPNTRWLRSVPQAGHQEAALKVMNKMGTWTEDNDGILCNLGFGKDKFTGRYKLVWLYNSFEFTLSNATVCEVYDFNNTNTWRYVTASPVRIFDEQAPVHLDGSLYWFTDEYITDTKVLSFDIHTEKFHMIAEAPFFEVGEKEIIMCTLNNRLCVSQKEWPKQEIWSLNNSDMTWEKIYSLDLQTDYDWFTDYLPPPCTYSPDVVPCAIPVAVLKNKKKTLVLYYPRAKNPNLLMVNKRSSNKTASQVISPKNAIDNTTVNHDLHYTHCDQLLQQRAMNLTQLGQTDGGLELKTKEFLKPTSFRVKQCK